MYKLLKYVLKNVFYSVSDLRQLLDTVAKELKILKQWFDINKLSLNLQKTKFKHEI